MIRWLFLLPLLAQDSAEDRITLEAKGPLSAVAERFERATGVRIRIEPGVEDRAIEMAVRNATFFEAADALCRAHGNAGYFERQFGRDRSRELVLPLFPGAWKDYPSCISGDFKFAAFQFLRERVRSDRGDAARVRLQAGLLFPPHLLAERGRDGIEWAIAEARDADGKDVLLPPEPGRVGPRIRLFSSVEPAARVQEGSIVLADFDLERGLSRLKGEATVRVWAGEEFRLPLEAGRPVRTHAGSVSFESLEPLGRGSWKIVLGADPDQVHGRARVHGLEGWCLLAPGKDGTMEATTVPLPAKPEWIAIRAWGGGHRVKVPFELKDIRFAGK